MIYVYAVIEATASPLDLSPGLEDQPVRISSESELAAVYSVHDRPIAATAEHLWRHEGVVETIMRQTTLIPARFGTTFADVEKLCDKLRLHRSKLVEGLNRVRGCVEIGIRIAPPPPAAAGRIADDASGRAYMLARLAEERARRGREESATGMLAELHELLRPLSRERSEPTMTHGALRTAYLVERDGAPALAARVVDFANKTADPKILCTGPWPAYHFVPDLSEAKHERS